MPDPTDAGTYHLGERAVRRMGYGAMQLAGPHVFGPPKDRAEAVAVLREAIALGVDHIDTSDYYGPHVTNALIREALHPYPKHLTIVTKVGAKRGAAGSWLPAFSPADLTSAVHDNLRNLGLDAIDVVNFRIMADPFAPKEGPIGPQIEALAKLRREGLIRHIGLSNATSAQVRQAGEITKVACVQNLYNVAHRRDDALVDELAAAGIAFVPYFPLGGIAPLKSKTLAEVAAGLGATAMQVALAWLLKRSPNILLIPGTSKLAHLRENHAAARLHLPPEAMATLDGIAAAA